MLAGFGYDQFWRVDKHHRFLGDITGDGRADIVGLGDDGVATAIATGDGGFGPAQFVLREFGVNQGWSMDRHPRFLTDITADGLADLVGIGPNGTVTAIARGDGTFFPAQSGGPFGSASLTPGAKVFAPDLNADGRSDLALITSAGVRTARSLGNGLFSPANTATTAYDLVNFDPSHYRVTDVTGDRRAEILGLQVNGPVRMVSSVPILDGTGTFTDPRPAGAAFPPGLPAPSVRLSAVADVTGDGRADLVAFGESVNGTWVAGSFGNGAFGPYQEAVLGFGPEGGWDATRTRGCWATSPVRTPPACAWRTSSASGTTASGPRSRRVAARSRRRRTSSRASATTTAAGGSSGTCGCSRTSPATGGTTSSGSATPGSTRRSPAATARSCCRPGRRCRSSAG